MVKSDLSLRAELADVVHDLIDLYNLAVELEFRDNPLNHYLYWNRNALSYTILARQALGAKDKTNWTRYEIDTYANKEDLKDLTNRLSITYSRITLAYNKEAGDELNQILHIITLCIAMMKASL